MLLHLPTSVASLYHLQAENVLVVITNCNKGLFTLFVQDFCLVPQVHRFMQYKFTPLQGHLLALWHVFLHEHDIDSVS